MRVLVTGGRHFTDRVLFETAMERIQLAGAITHIIHGGASGADAMAADWAQRHGVSFTTYPAEWETYGRAAGPIRNKQMLEQGKPDLVIAFPGGPGTADMTEQARRAKVDVWDFT